MKQDAERLTAGLSEKQRRLHSRLYKSDQAYKEFLLAYEALMATWEVDYTSRFAKSDFGETHIIDTISARMDNPVTLPLVMIPGGQGTAGMWGPLMPVLCDQHRVISLDLIDQVGRSKPSKVLENRKDAALWIAQTLDSLGLDEVNLVGNSIGSFIATQFANRYPERVQRLILTAPAATFAPIRLGYLLKVMLTMISPFEKSKRRFILGTANQRGDPASPLIKLLINAMCGSRVISKLTPSVWSDAKIQSFKTPTLGIFGECDDVNTLGAEETIAKLKGINPDINTDIIADAGHIFTTDDFRHCAILIADFLQTPEGEID